MTSYGDMETQTNFRLLFILRPCVLRPLVLYFDDVFEASGRELGAVVTGRVQLASHNSTTFQPIMAPFGQGRVRAKSAVVARGGEDKVGKLYPASWSHLSWIMQSENQAQGGNG